MLDNISFLTKQADKNTHTHPPTRPRPGRSKHSVEKLAISQEATMPSPGSVALLTLSVVGNLLPQSVAFRVQPPTAVSTSTTENVNYPWDSRRFDRRHDYHRSDGVLKMTARGGNEQEESAVTRGGFLVSFATVAAGAGTMLGAVGGFPREARATGMLNFPPAKLNNRCVLLVVEVGDECRRRHSAATDDASCVLRVSKVVAAVLWCLVESRSLQVVVCLLGSAVYPGYNVALLILQHQYYYDCAVFWTTFVSCYHCALFF